MEILVPIAFFAMLAAIFVGPKYLAARSRDRMLETLRIAYERGQPVAPELIAAINVEPTDKPVRLVRSPQDRAESELKSGVIWLVSGLALITLGYAIYIVDGDADAVGITMGLAAFPGFIGLALIAFGLIGRRRSVA